MDNIGVNFKKVGHLGKNVTSKITTMSYILAEKHSKLSTFKLKTWRFGVRGPLQSNKEYNTFMDRWLTVINFVISVLSSNL